MSRTFPRLGGRSGLARAAVEVRVRSAARVVAAGGEDSQLRDGFRAGPDRFQITSLRARSPVSPRPGRRSSPGSGSRPFSLWRAACGRTPWVFDGASSAYRHDPAIFAAVGKRDGIFVSQFTSEWLD